MVTKKYAIDFHMSDGSVKTVEFEVPQADIDQCVLRDGSNPMTADLSMGGHRVTGLGEPVADGDAVPRGYANGHFAPTGYGLGNNFKTTDTPSVVDTYQQCGWARYVNPNGVSLVEGFDVYYALIRIDSYSAGSYVTKTLFPVSYRGCKLERHLQSDGTWSEWEWVNPPMIPDVEYRTTERWNDKPVYRKIVSHTNSVTWAGNNTYPVAHGVSNLDLNNVEIVLKTAGYCMPYLGADGTTAVAFIDATHITVRTTGSVSWDSRNWYFEMKYTKSV